MSKPCKDCDEEIIKIVNEARIEELEKENAELKARLIHIVSDLMELTRRCTLIGGSE